PLTSSSFIQDSLAYCAEQLPGNTAECSCANQVPPDDSQADGHVIFSNASSRQEAGRRPAKIALRIDFSRDLHTRRVIVCPELALEPRALALQDLDLHVPLGKLFASKFPREFSFPGGSCTKPIVCREGIFLWVDHQLVNSANEDSASRIGD